MSQSKPNDTPKIIALSAGIVGALGIAGWQISAATTTTPSGPSASSTAPSSSASLAPAPASPTTPPSTAATTPYPGSSEVLPDGLEPEETLAINVDPFLPLTDPVATPSPAVGIAATSLPTRATIGESSDLLFGPTLPQVAQVAPVQKVAPLEPPVLLGTLLGNAPSAVFKAEGGVRVLAVGETFDGWTLLEVTHGAAVLRGYGSRRQVSLHTGVSRKHSAQNEPSFPEGTRIPVVVSADGRPVATVTGKSKSVVESDGVQAELVAVQETVEAKDILPNSVRSDNGLLTDGVTKVGSAAGAVPASPEPPSGG